MINKFLLNVNIKASERDNEVAPSGTKAISGAYQLLTIWLLYSRAYCISHIISFIENTPMHIHD